MNNIKSISTYLVEGEAEQKIHIYEERDQQGNVTLLKQFNDEEELEAKSAYEFDKEGRVIIEKQYSSGDLPDQSLEIKYNESGKAEQVIITYADGSVSYKNYTRDTEVRSTTIDIIDEDGDTEGKEFRRFDEEDRLLEEVIYDDSGKVETKAEFEYNEHGDVVESFRVDEEGFETIRFYDYYRNDQSQINKIEMLNADEKIIRVDEFEYDERGNQTKHSMHDLDRGSLFVDVRVYDMNNREIKFERLMGDRPIEVKDTRYTADGLMEEQETRTNDGVLTHRFVYELY